MAAQMTRELAAFRERAMLALYEAGAAANVEADCEAALSILTRGAFDLLGDRGAHERPGALKDGERQFFVAGIFLVEPGEAGHRLVAQHGFPPEQPRLHIDLDVAHAGWVYRHRSPLILANTDEDKGFKQILKTARMGSAMYGPMLHEGRMLGQFIMAAQARNTFGQPDLDVLLVFAQLATAIYAAKAGDAFLARAMEDEPGRSN